MDSIVKYVEDKFIEKKEFPKFSAGDTITVYYEITEGGKTRTQFFRGVVIQRRVKGSTETFTFRKISCEIGVERIFLVNLLAILRLEVIKRGKVIRASILYFN